MVIVFMFDDTRFPVATSRSRCPPRSSSTSRSPTQRSSSASSERAGRPRGALEAAATGKVDFGGWLAPEAEQGTTPRPRAARGYAVVSLAQTAEGFHPRHLAGDVSPTAPQQSAQRNREPWSQCVGTAAGF